MSKIAAPIVTLLEELNHSTTYGYWVVLKENDLTRPYLLRWYDQGGNLNLLIPEDTEHYKQTYGGLHMTELYHYMLGLIDHKNIKDIINNRAEEMKEL